MIVGVILERVRFCWNAFWHAEASPFALGLFRILFSYCLYREVSTTRARSVFAIAEGGYHLPYVSWIPLAPEWAYDVIHDLQYPFIVLLGIGLFPRVSCAVLLLLQGYVFFADQLNFRNHPYFFLLVLLLLMLSPAGKALSLQGAMRAWRKNESIASALFGKPHPVTMQRLIQVQVCLVYFLAGLQKLRPSYLEGRVLHRLLAGDLPTRTSGFLLERFVTREDLITLFEAGWIFSVMAFATALLELGLPLALWYRRARPLAILLGTGFHLLIAFLMEIHVFSYAVIASYLLFLEPDTLPKTFSRLCGHWRGDPFHSARPDPSGR